MFAKSILACRSDKRFSGFHSIGHLQVSHDLPGVAAFDAGASGNET